MVEVPLATLIGFFYFINYNGFQSALDVLDIVFFS